MKTVKLESDVHHSLTLLKAKYKFKTYTELLKYLMDIEAKEEEKKEE
jgi:hypothetical protein